MSDEAAPPTGDMERFIAWLNQGAEEDTSLSCAKHRTQAHPEWARYTAWKKALPPIEGGSV